MCFLLSRKSSCGFLSSLPGDQVSQVAGSFFYLMDYFGILYSSAPSPDPSKGQRFLCFSTSHQKGFPTLVFSLPCFFGGRLSRPFPSSGFWSPPSFFRSLRSPSLPSVFSFFSPYSPTGTGSHQFLAFDPGPSYLLVFIRFGFFDSP